MYHPFHRNIFHHHHFGLNVHEIENAIRLVFRQVSDEEFLQEGARDELLNRVMLRIRQDLRPDVLPQFHAAFDQEFERRRERWWRWVEGRDPRRGRQVARGPAVPSAAADSVHLQLPAVSKGRITILRANLVDDHNSLTFADFENGEDVIILQRAKYGYKHMFSVDPAGLAGWFATGKRTNPKTQEIIREKDIERFTLRLVTQEELNAENAAFTQEVTKKEEAKMAADEAEAAAADHEVEAQRLAAYGNSRESPNTPRATLGFSGFGGRRRSTFRKNRSSNRRNTKKN